jgi:hypothetical protein
MNPGLAPDKGARLIFVAWSPAGNRFGFDMRFATSSTIEPVILTFYALVIWGGKFL